MSPKELSSQDIPDSLKGAIDEVHRALATRAATIAVKSKTIELRALQKDCLEQFELLERDLGPQLQNLRSRRCLRSTATPTPINTTDSSDGSVALAANFTDLDAQGVRLLDSVTMALGQMNDKLQHCASRVHRVAATVEHASVLFRNVNEWIPSFDSNKTHCIIHPILTIEDQGDGRDCVVSPFSSHVRHQCTMVLEEAARLEEVAEDRVRSGALFLREAELLNQLTQSMLSLYDTKLAVCRRQKERLREELRLRALSLLPKG